MPSPPTATARSASTLLAIRFSDTRAAEISRRSDEPPVVGESRRGVVQAIMRAQIGRALRRGVLLQIRRRTSQHETPPRETPFYQGRIGRRQPRDRQIEALLHEVDHEVASAQIE